MRKLVYILDMNGTPLMPCEPVVARLLRKGGGTKCVKREPFTIKLLQPTTEYRQPLTLGIDPGSTKIGAAVVDNFGNVVYMSEVEVRNDVTDNMKQRAMYRRNRRNRKCRYRKCRFLNRKNSIRKDRFSPTVVSKMSSHLKEIAFVKSILPITEVVVETAKFDPHALKNPAVLTNNWLYQHGTNFGFANTHALMFLTATNMLVSIAMESQKTSDWKSITLFSDAMVARTMRAT